MFLITFQYLSNSTHQKANANNEKVSKRSRDPQKKYEDDLLAMVGNQDEDRECIGKDCL